jgi:ABC-type sugar transport system ATPase subunit
MIPILSMRGIHKSFGGVHALDNVNFDLHRAKFTVCWAETARARLRS